MHIFFFFFFFQAEDGIRDYKVTGVQTCALPIYLSGEPRTLWGAFSKQTAVLRIAPDRGKQHLHGLIGDSFAGVVGSDRFSAYNSLDPERRQVCWSHLRRDFTFHAELGLGVQETFGLDGLEVTWKVFHAWKQFQQDGDRAALRQRVEEIKKQ